MSMFIGEALAGDGNEIAHIDLLNRQQRWPCWSCVCQCLGSSKQWSLEPVGCVDSQLAVKPSTVMITKVTIKGAKQAVQMFGPAQAAVAKAVLIRLVLV